MSEIFVAGVGMTPFGRLSEHDVKSLTRWAVSEAIQDAGGELCDIEIAYFANAAQGHMEGQHMIRGQLALRAMGIGGIPVVNVENACASASTAFNLAVNALKAGQADVALAVGVEKMVSADKALMFGSFDSAWDVATVERNKDTLVRLGHLVEVPVGSMSDKPYSVFMDVYAAFARDHMFRYGTTRRQMAAVSSKNHEHSVHNPLAQFQKRFTVEEVLAAPPIAYPLTLPMCAPVSDGGAAAILTTDRGLRRLGTSRSRAVRVLATVLRTGTDRTENEPENHCTVHAARRAYELAGISPADISVAEVHDATAMGEIIQIENLQLAGRGEGGVVSERGHTRVGGRIPVNPSGGLESKGHPIGATGLAQIYELVAQLRGEAGRRQVSGARIGVAENGGGVIGVEEAVATVTVLGT
jgi:acetyl-CoA acetyltransferase